MIYKIWGGKESCNITPKVWRQNASALFDVGGFMTFISVGYQAICKVFYIKLETLVLWKYTILIIKY